MVKDYQKDHQILSFGFVPHTKVCGLLRICGDPRKIQAIQPLFENSGFLSRVNKIPRRQFLIRLGGVGLTALVSTDFQTAYASTPKSSETEDKYLTLTNIRVKVMNKYDILISKFRIKKETWETLPKGLSTQELYDKIKDMKLQYEITALVKPSDLPRIVNLYHQGPINHEDIRSEFLKRAEQYVRRGVPELNLDYNLKFEENDKSALESLLSSQNLASFEKGNINPWLERQRKVYIYPPGSKVIFETSPNEGSIQVLTKNDNGYNKQDPIKLADKSGIESLHKFFRFSLLSVDPILKDFPMKQLVEVYETGKSLDNTFSLNEEEAMRFKR